MQSFKQTIQVVCWVGAVISNLTDGSEVGCLLVYTVKCNVHFGLSVNKDHLDLGDNILQRISSSVLEDWPEETGLCVDY